MLWIVIIFSICLLVLLLGLKRSYMVLQFVFRLIDEESAWAKSNLQKWAGYNTFMRYNSLPNQWKMTLCFWKPLNKKSWNIGEVESYYR